MRFEFMSAYDFMGAFQKRQGDDRYSILLRTLRVAHLGIFIGAFVLMVDSARSAYQGKSMDDALVHAAFFALAMSVFYASYRVDKGVGVPLRKIFLVPGILLLVLAAGEAGMLPDSWQMEEVLPWWRGAFLLIAAVTAALWAVERNVQSRRAGQEGLGSLG